MSARTSAGVFGGVLSRESAPIESASPKTKSDRVSIRGLGVARGALSGKEMKGSRLC